MANSQFVVEMNPFFSEFSIAADTHDRLTAIMFIDTLKFVASSTLGDTIDYSESIYVTLHVDRRFFPSRQNIER